MRNLRERLMAVSAASPKPAVSSPKAPRAREGAFYCRESVVPIEYLCGIERTTLQEVRACDPAFTGEIWDTGRLLFLDTETTGLSGGAGTVAFEIGIGFIDARGMVIRQYVMRDYDEEAAMLCEIAKLFEGRCAVVTFNGKSFDLPLLESRLMMNRIRLRLTSYPHLDLLHACRRVYKLRLGRCNLSALEAAVLGRKREDDLPGAQVPQRYFEYLRTGEFALLDDVLRHNLKDVQSLAELTGRLCEAFRQPLALEHPEDIFGVGRTLMRGGHTREARRCFKVLGKSTLAPQAHMHLAASYKKGREWAEEISACQDMVAGGEGGIWPYVELAKYYEHIAHDIPRALGYANGALTYALNTAPLRGEDERERALLMRRIDRLRRKLRAAEYTVHEKEE